MEDRYPNPDDWASVRRAWDGLCAARTRLRQTGPKYKFAPLTEFCWWAISLDEGLDRLLDNYRADRDQDLDGQVVAGLRFIRNALGHDRLIVTRHEGGLSMPVRFPLTIGPIVARWVDADSLPVADPGRAHSNRENYDRWVAGRPVEETTTQATRWLGRQTDRL